LQYSYDKLDDTSQKCFLHFAAFPEDDRISTNYLCDIWHVQQLFGSRNAQETRDLGISILMDLADRSLIEMSSDGEYVQIHDVLRDLANQILSKAKQDEWASQCYFQVGKDFETFPTIGKHVKIVSLIGCTFREFPNSLELPILQVCLLSRISHAKDLESLVISKGFFSSMKDLRLLNLGGSVGVNCNLLNFRGLTSLMHLYLNGYSSLTQLPEGIQELKSLTHLDVSNCESLTQLPEGIKELKSLTHLDLQWCQSLTQLPEGIEELKSLTHLYLQGCSSLKQLPKGIKELKSLMPLD
jgi:Leucine-rich repeat (LRR) protein